MGRHLDHGQEVPVALGSDCQRSIIIFQIMHLVAGYLISGGSSRMKRAAELVFENSPARVPQPRLASKERTRTWAPARTRCQLKAPPSRKEHEKGRAPASCVLKAWASPQ